jgi:DNA-binding response OmpR family regulator
MQLRVMAIGNENITRRLASSLACGGVDLVCQSEVPQAIDLLKQEKFDLALIDGYMNNIENTCYRISWLCRTSVALIIKGPQTDWSKFRSVNVDGFISEESEPIEILAQLQAIARRNNRELSRAKILIIEGDELIRETLELSFKIYWPAAEIHTASLGEAGIKIAQSEPLDAILLDLKLSDISGFEVLSQIRKTSLTPIIILTTNREQAEVVKAIEYGADDYLIKPFKQIDLMSRIRHHIDIVTNMN